MFIYQLVLVALLSVASVTAQSSTAPSEKKIPGLDVSAIDGSVSPCEDFYRYSCGAWMANNPIPPDQSRWGRFNVLRENNQELLRDIVDQASQPDGDRNPVDKKIGDYYASCMDEAAIERKGLDPLQPTLERIAELSSKSELPAAIAHLHSIGVPALFRFTSTEDFKDASQVIAEVDQGGLGLPDRDYYFREDPKAEEQREKYIGHVEKMFTLLGHDPGRSAEMARKVMEIETELARASLDRVARREPDNVYHKWPKSKLVETSRSFAWPSYFEGTRVAAFDELNVAVPAFFEKLDELIESTPLEDWKTYLTWHTLRASAPLLPKAFVDENFDFYGKTLSGAKEIRPRWKRCVSFVDSDLGEALGQRYVDKHFPPQSKQRMLELVHALEKALAQDIRELPWMTAETKKQALVKLDAITNKIGYPDKWRDYGPLKIVRDDAFGNSQRANRFEFRRDLNKVGKPSDRMEWLMSSPTVNAYYHPLHNNINFPAGILQPPFFDGEGDDAVNFGAIGAVIGHELTHGFDDKGRKFDSDGNLNDWWTEQDAQAFEQRASCFDQQYAGYTAVEEVNVNGKLTLGENTADNGGLRVAYMALADVLDNGQAEKIDGFTPGQRFFLGWSQVWCMNITDEMARMLAQVDTHSPAKHRVNGAVSNMPEFHEAFGCKPAQPMVRDPACRVW